jgi:hypothetical protein
MNSYSNSYTTAFGQGSRVGCILDLRIYEQGYGKKSPMDVIGEGRGGKIYFVIDDVPCGLAFDNVYPPLCPAISFYADGEKLALVKNATLKVRDFTVDQRKAS